MRDLAKKFRRVPFLLERIGIIRRADDLDLVGDQFPFLSFALRGDKRAAHPDRSAGGQLLNVGIIRERIPRDDLEIAQRRAVVQFDERKILRITPGPHPALDLNRINWARRICSASLIDVGESVVISRNGSTFNAQGPTFNVQRRQDRQSHLQRLAQMRDEALAKFNRIARASSATTPDN